MSKLTLQATISSLPKALEFIRTHAATHGLCENSIYQLEIAAEEAIVNTMLYGYPHPDPNNMITVEVLADATDCFLILTDEGVPFDPTQHVPDPDTTAEPGGLGIFFIYKYTDRVSYERLGSSNQLTLFKKRG